MTRTAGSRNKEADEHYRILDEATEWKLKHKSFQISIIKEKKTKTKKNKIVTYSMFELIRIQTVMFSGCHCLLNHMEKQLSKIEGKKF